MEMVKHKRLAFPFASLVLTFIGALITSRRVRVGIGLHLGLGLLLSFTYILFMKIAITFSLNAGLDPMIANWIPNIIFGLIAIFLLWKAPK
jgi:lipopolysaccharide export system permease protein